MKSTGYSKILFLIVCLPVFAISCVHKGKYRLVWSDEFNGTALDTTQWRIITGNASQYGKPGYGNGELEDYTANKGNITVRNGKLIITARRDSINGKNYTSARIRTRDNYSWKYGKFVARIRLPYGQGMWPAFWMLPTENKTGLGCRLSKTPEIDIMEMIGRNPATDYGTAHWWANGHHMKGGHFMLPTGNLSDGYHTYAVEWGGHSIKWFFDGKQYFEVTSDDVQPNQWPYNNKFTIILNLAVGGTWPGNPDSTTHFPEHMYVDYVRVYQKR